MTGHHIFNLQDQMPTFQSPSPLYHSIGHFLSNKLFHLLLTDPMPWLVARHLAHFSSPDRCTLFFLPSWFYSKSVQKIDVRVIKIMRHGSTKHKQLSYDSSQHTPLHTPQASKGTCLHMSNETSSQKSVYMRLQFKVLISNQFCQSLEGHLDEELGMEKSPKFCIVKIDNGYCYSTTPTQFLPAGLAIG